MKSKKKNLKILLLMYSVLGIPVFLALMYLLHITIAMEDDPTVGLGGGFSAGLNHMLYHPLEILPIPTAFPVIVIVVVLIVATLMFFSNSNAKLRKHHNPDTVMGSSKLLNDLDTYNKRFSDPVGKVENDGPNNVIICKELKLAMANEKTGRNLNSLIIGGSGSGKSFAYVGPNILQMNASFVVTDPSGGLFQGYGKVLEYYGYNVKCFNISDMDQGNHYNPFNYIHSDKDIEILVNTLISNTTPKDKQGGDPFWEKSETALLVALIAYLYHYTDKKLQSFSNVMRLLRAADIDENDSTTKSPLDEMFEEINEQDPDNFAGKQYATFKMGAGKTLKSILISVAVRLQAFDLEDVINLTDTDDIDLDTVCDTKTALFIIIPTGENTFNFLASLMYSQLFQRFYAYAEKTSKFSYLIMDSDSQVIKTFRANSFTETINAKKNATEFLERAKKGYIEYNENFEWWELRTQSGELVFWRGSKEEAEKEFVRLKSGKVISNAERENDGNRLPIHTRFLLDEFANIGKIPNFPEKVATIRKYEISVAIILQSITQLKNLYEKNWEELSGNCDTTVYLGGGADTTTTKWISELLGKETRVVMNVSMSKSGGSTSLNRQGVELLAPSELRTMDENKCIVLMRSENGYLGDKYKAFWHPMWETKKKLGRYFFNANKTFDLYKELSGTSAEKLIKELHGNPVEEKEEDKASRENRNEIRQQMAEEYKNNMDVNGQSIISDAKSVNDEYEGLEKKMGLSGEENILDKIDETLTSTAEEWGIEDIEFSEAGRNLNYDGDY